MKISTKCDDCRCQLPDADGKWVELGYDQINQKWINVCVACSNKPNGDEVLYEIKVDLGGC